MKITLSLNWREPGGWCVSSWRTRHWCTCGSWSSPAQAAPPRQVDQLNQFVERERDGVSDPYSFFTHLDPDVILNLSSKLRIRIRNCVPNTYGRSNFQFNYLYSVYLLKTFTFRTITFILIPLKGRFFAILARREQVLKENDDVICWARANYWKVYTIKARRTAIP